MMKTGKIFLNYGFTLVEMVVVLIIVGVMVSFALPSYKTYIKRARLDEAKAILIKYSTYLQEYYNDHGTYQRSDGKYVEFDDLHEDKHTQDRSKYFNFSIAGHVDNDNNERITLQAVPNQTYIKQEKRYLKTNQYGNILLCQGFDDKIQCEAE